MTSSAGSFVYALEVASQPNYLGSIQVVDDYIRTFLFDALQRRSHDLDIGEIVKQDMAAVASAARVFLGEDSNFAAMPGWNRPGMIDVSAARRMSMEEADPRQRMENVFTELLIEFFRLCDQAANPAAAQDFCQMHLEAIIQSYTEVLLGISTWED